MVRLTSVTVFGAAPAGLTPAIVDLDVVAINDQPRLYALTAGGGRMLVYDLSGAQLSNVALPGSLGYFSTPQIEVLSNGNTTLAMPFGLSNTRSSVMQLNASGAVSGPLTYAGGADGPVDLRAVSSLQTDIGTWVFGAPALTGRIAGFGLQPDGTLASVAEITLSGDSTARITATAAIQTTEGGVLVAATANGLFVHDIGANGGLTPRAALPQIDGLGLAEISAVTAVTTAQGQSYVLATGSGSSSVAVLRLEDNDLVAVDHVLDTRTTRFGTATVLETIEMDGRIFVVLAGGDHGISLFTLMPDGRLIHLSTLEDSLQTTLDSGGAIALSATDTLLYVYVSGGRGEGITRLEFDVGRAGVQIIGGAGRIDGSTDSDVLMAGTSTTELSGGGGQDILASNGHAVRLTGGAGADIFVLSPVTGTIRISDFDPLQDRLDLTLFPMLRSLDQVAIRSTATGAVLTIGTTIIDITSATGSSLPLSVFQNQTLLPIDRLGDFRLTLPPEGTDAADTLALGLTAGSVLGLGGNDTIYGSPGDDTIYGGDGGDQIFGGDGNDSIDGGADEDLISAGRGNDTLYGAAGNDTLQGGRDHDLLFGGSGDDLLSGEHGNDTIYGGQNNDTLYGGAGNDSLFGDEGFDTIYGGSSDDYIDGGMQADFLHGDDGNDTIFGGQGFDVISGNAGDDLLYGGSDQDWMFGGPNNDTLYGGDGIDFLFGGIGFDTIYGGNGDDRIQGEDGADFLHGDDGNDTIFGGQGFDVVSGNAGNDVLFGGDTQDWMFGGWDNDLIDGGAGDDFIFCGIGNDTAYGQDGNDHIAGEWGDDVLFGGAGNDTLRGGPGNDTLYGGPGADRFILTGGGNNRIMDFNPLQPGEVIVINDFGITGGWAMLRDTRMLDTPDGVFIDLGPGQSVTLAGLTRDQLSGDDFIL